MRSLWPRLTVGGDDPGADEVGLVGHEDDGVGGDEADRLEVVEDALGLLEALLLVDRVDDDEAVRVVRRDEVLHLETKKNCQDYC